MKTKPTYLTLLGIILTLTSGISFAAVSVTLGTCKIYSTNRYFYTYYGVKTESSENNASIKLIQRYKTRSEGGHYTYSDVQTTSVPSISEQAACQQAETNCKSGSTNNRWQPVLCDSAG